ncbi:MAG: hypothetical protein SOX43_01035 [Pelistega sp.]|nr:hypothetical protein [Pelistega sp.]
MSEHDVFVSTYSRHLGDEVEGFEIITSVNGLNLFIGFLLGENNFDLLPTVIPAERFQDGSDIHVGELHSDILSITDELEAILANMNDGDTVIFFCENQDLIKEALLFLNFPVEDEPPATLH